MRRKQESAWRALLAFEGAIAQFTRPTMSIEIGWRRLRCEKGVEVAKTEQADFDATPGRVFDACRRAMANLGYTLIGADESGRMISFNTGRSMKSWAGQDLQATVIPSDSGAQVVVGGTLARRGGLAGGQQVAWGEKSALSKKFLREVGQVLPKVPEPGPVSNLAETEKSKNLSDDLAALKVLHDDGTLSEDEFKRA
jgi:hypothetical protein